jgi:hypothetical protein
MTDAKLASTGRPVDEAAIERILKAVGEKFVPANIDRAALRQDLEYWGGWYDDAVVIDNRTLARRRKEKLSSIRNACARMLKIDEDVWNLVIGTQAIFRGPYHEDPRYAIQCLLVDVNRTLKPPDTPQLRTPDKDDLFAENSPFERLAGKHLKRVFEKHFHGVNPHSYTRTTEGEADGPYIRFAHQGLIALGVVNPRGDPYTCGAIADAVSHYRNKAPLLGHAD